MSALQTRRAEVRMPWQDGLQMQPLEVGGMKGGNQRKSVMKLAMAGSTRRGRGRTTGGRGRTNRRKVAETFDEGEAERKPLVDVVDMVAFESQLFDIWTECVTVQSAKELSDEILHREMLTRDCA